MPNFYFYLLNVTFQSPTGTTAEELGNRIEYLATDCESIRRNGEIIYRHDTIYETPMFEGITFVDIVYNEHSILTRDQKKYLQIIIDKSIHTLCDNNDIIKLLASNNAEEINGLLCLFPVEDDNIPMDCQIYCLRDWLKFHREYFIKFPPQRGEFCSQLSPWFPNIYFNPSSIPVGLRGLHTDFQKIMKSIIHHLTALNDVYHPFFLQNRNLGGDGACDYLENSFKNHQVQIGASRDRNDLDELYFTFKDEAKNTHLRCYCDLHTKFYQYFEYKNPSYQAKGNRIYFHQPIDDFLEGKLLIGRIGKHASNG